MDELIIQGHWGPWKRLRVSRDESGVGLWMSSVSGIEKSTFVMWAMALLLEWYEGEAQVREQS